MAPYEALYGKRCKTPLYWEEIRDKKLYGMKLVQVIIEKVRIIKDQIKATRDRQKKYVYVRKRPLKFNVGDQVFLKVVPWKNMMRFGLKGKLAPRFIRPVKSCNVLDRQPTKQTCPRSQPRSTMYSMSPCYERPTWIPLEFYLGSDKSKKGPNAQSQAHKNSRLVSERTTK